MQLTILYILLVLFLATLVRSAFGFGEALLSVPLLALKIPIAIAAPLAVLVSITIATVILFQDRRMVHVRSVGWLVFSTLLGIPLGLLLLKTGDQRIVKVVLAIFILAFSAYSLSDRGGFRLDRDNRAWLLGCGFLAGVFGGAYGMNGPPLAIYGSMRRWSAQHFRATLQGYFLPASLIGMFGYWIMGLWVPTVTHYYLLSFPVILPAVFLGRAINRRMHEELFQKFLYAGLACISVVLFMQAIRS